MAKEPGTIMRQEIREQPQAIAATVAREAPALDELVARLKREDISAALVVARGTSDNAAQYGLYMLGAVTNKLVALAAPSLFTCYHTRMDLRKTLVIGVSQSGKATDVIEVLEAGREAGAVTCALTNTEDSPICNAVDHVLLTHAREERAVAATKTYTTALAIFHQLATRWAGRDDLVAEIEQVPGWVEEAFALEDRIAGFAERFRFMGTCHWLGRGMNYCTAKESALKMAECCYVVPSPFSTADFQHGPIATTDRGFPCFIVAPEGETFASVYEVISALKERGAEMLIISNNQDALAQGKIGLAIPSIPEECSPMVAGVVGQMIALHVALEKGLDPDQPRGLNKVTLTV